MPKMTGAQVMAEMLKGYGVTHTFLVPAVLRRSMAEMEERTNIARIQTHGEKSAAYMADGYARAGKKPGVCMAQVIGRAEPRGGPAGRLSGESPRARLHGRARSADQVPKSLPGGGRRARLRAGDEVQRHGGRRLALPGHAPPGLPRRHLGLPGPCAPAVRRQRGPARHRRGRDGGDHRRGLQGASPLPARTRDG